MRPGWEASLSIVVLTLFFTATTVMRPAPERSRPSRSHAAPRVTLPVAGQNVTQIVGNEAGYTARPGDTLLSVARAHNTDALTLANLNHITSARLKPGQTLRLPTLNILPLEIPNGIVLNIPERGVYLFRNGRFVARYPVAIGMRTWETPTGVYRLIRKVINPTWLPPRVMVEREGISSGDVAPGHNNPLGDRWMGWSAPEVGFHSTFATESVGRLASHACVRMYPECAHRMFAVVWLGMPIYSLYEPIKIGRRGDDCYLSVSPDVYRYQPVSFARVWKRLEALGIAHDADQQSVRWIVNARDGYPYRIGHFQAQ